MFQNPRNPLEQQPITQSSSDLQDQQEVNWKNRFDVQDPQVIMQMEDNRVENNLDKFQKIQVREKQIYLTSNEKGLEDSATKIQLPESPPAFDVQQFQIQRISSKIKSHSTNCSPKSQIISTHQHHSIVQNLAGSRPESRNQNLKQHKMPKALQMYCKNYHNKQKQQLTCQQIEKSQLSSRQTQNKQKQAVMSNIDIQRIYNIDTSSRILSTLNQKSRGNQKESIMKASIQKEQQNIEEIPAISKVLKKQNLQKAFILYGNEQQRTQLSDQQQILQDKSKLIQSPLNIQLDQKSNNTGSDQLEQSPIIFDNLGYEGTFQNQSVCYKVESSNKINDIVPQMSGYKKKVQSECIDSYQDCEESDPHQQNQMDDNLMFDQKSGMRYQNPSTTDDCESSKSPQDQQSLLLEESQKLKNMFIQRKLSIEVSSYSKKSQDINNLQILKVNSDDKTSNEQINQDQVNVIYSASTSKKQEYQKFKFINGEKIDLNTFQKQRTNVDTSQKSGLENLKQQIQKRRAHYRSEVVSQACSPEAEKELQIAGSIENPHVFPRIQSRRSLGYQEENIRNASANIKSPIYTSRKYNSGSLPVSREVSKIRDIQQQLINHETESKSNVMLNQRDQELFPKFIPPTLIDTFGLTSNAQPQLKRQMNDKGLKVLTFIPDRPLIQPFHFKRISADITNEANSATVKSNYLNILNEDKIMFQFQSPFKNSQTQRFQSTRKSCAIQSNLNQEIQLDSQNYLQIQEPLSAQLTSTKNTPQQFFFLSQYPLVSLPKKALKRNESKLKFNKLMNFNVQTQLDELTDGVMLVKRKERLEKELTLKLNDFKQKQVKFQLPNIQSQNSQKQYKNYDMFQVEEED
eukprot:403339037